MKNFTFSLLFMLLSSSYPCQAMDPPEPETIFAGKQHGISVTLSDEEFNRQFLPLLKNFKLNKETKIIQCVADPSDFFNISQKFQELYEHRPTHRNLNLYFARFIGHRGLSLGNADYYMIGLEMFAQALTVSCSNAEEREFLNYFTCLNDSKGRSLGRFIIEMGKLVTKYCPNPISNLIDNQQQNRMIDRGYVERTFKDNVIEFFRGLKPIVPTVCYDQALKTIIYTTLDGYDLSNCATNIVITLYNDGPEQASPLLKYQYVSRYLAARDCGKAIPIFESLLGSALDRANTIQSYYMLADCYRRATKRIPIETQEGVMEDGYSPEDLEKLQKALRCLENVKYLRLLNTEEVDTNCPWLFYRSLASLATIHVSLKNYSEAAEAYNNLWAIVDLKEKIRKEEFTYIKSNYKYFLHLTGNIKEIEQIDLKKMKKTFQKDKAIAQRLRETQDREAKLQHAREESERQLRAITQQQTMDRATLAQEKQKMANSEEAEKEIPQLSVWKEPVPEKTVPKKQKKKTRGIAQGSPIPLPQPKPVALLPIIYASELGFNTQSQATMNEIFEPFPVVTYGKLKALAKNMDAILSKKNQPQKKTLQTNKSSHVKFTFSPHDWGLEGNEQSTMVTPLIQEKRYQAKHLRDLFLSIGIVPDRNAARIQTLRNEGWLVGFSD